MLYTFLNLFEISQIIYFKDPKDNTSKVVCTCRLDNLEDTLVGLIEEYKNVNIHLYGNQTYGEAIKENIENTLITKYKNNTTKVFIN